MIDKIGSESLQPVIHRDEPARMRDAAGEFESLLIGQLMKSVRESSSGWLSDGDEDQAGSTATELAEEQFAKALAQQGGLGLARMVVSGVEKATSSGSGIARPLR